MKFYNRHISQVIKRQEKRKPALIVTGPRQVGKTTILKHIVGESARYVTLDDPILRVNAEDNATAFIAENKPPIIIDEIQKCPQIFDYIKMKVDEDLMSGQYYLTGSHSFELMRGVTESLAGRAGIIKMLGLSLRELSQVGYSVPFLPTKTHIDEMSNGRQKKRYDELTKIVHAGSFPEIHKTESDLKDWKDYYSSYVQSYLEKDVREIIKAENMSAFIKFIKGVASLSGEQLNTTLLAEICGKSVPTVSSWLSVLEMSGHIYLLQPYANNQNKRLSKSPKLYLLDTGLLCYLSGWNTPEQLTSGARWGHIFETYVVSEILKSYYNDGEIYPPLFYYRDKDKIEIDIIIEDNKTLYPIEIKTTTSPSKAMIKNFSVLDRIHDRKR
ncbi:MAG: ATP-binding protein, partial [Firmicutes bacterium]|nr:ATP-binding protein [Bacillota bacterium]